MRNTVNLNKEWYFTKNSTDISSTDGVKVDLPHTWNAEDGYDGGNDYFRGTCVYTKTITLAELPRSELYYLEFRGANSSATVYVNGKKLAHHDGGYSTWRVNITREMTETTQIAMTVDNSPSEAVYPQMADFTFYGGLYRDVNLICVSKTHFDLDSCGSPGIKITPTVNGVNATVEIVAYTVDLRDCQTLTYTVSDGDGNEILKKETADTTVTLEIPKVRLWNGKKDPYLYRCTVDITENGEILDTVSSSFGCRSFNIDPQNGFILNGEEYPLRGVSRHQDRFGVGNALLPKHHEEDMEMIREIGATTVRLAHYQHDQYFYDLCDRYGIVVWAEIPYISKHLKNGLENTVSQMKELISQCYNHPSIVAWGLSNEITIGGTSEELLNNHRILNELAHEMDPTRSTVVAAVSMCDPNDPYLKIPDAVSYNHYFGWYGGETSMNGPWFDKFHTLHPDIPIGCSEYGCEALNWHTSEPRQGDYTEEYQAYYHEELIKQLFKRKYIWATHVWNMFDFGADARAEGGENGQNHKGLVTMDRKYKKDAFYAYKAWLVSPTDSPFVHICGKRYVDRTENVTKVTVYSNLPEVELFVNGESVGKKRTADHFFYFAVPNSGESTLTAKAGSVTDESTIRKVEKPNPDYTLVEKGAVLNWFDVSMPENRFSLNDKISDIMNTKSGKLWFTLFMLRLKRKSALNKKSGVEKNGSGGFEADFKNGSAMMEMLGGFTVLRFTSMLSMMNVTFTKNELLKMNKTLNLIRKPKSKG